MTCSLGGSLGGGWNGGLLTWSSENAAGRWGRAGRPLGGRRETLSQISSTHIALGPKFIRTWKSTQQPSSYS